MAQLDRTRFAGRRALVTGASRGIGAGSAERLAAEGVDVSIVARTVAHHRTLPGSLRDTAEVLGTHGGLVATIVAYLSDSEDRARIVPEAVDGLGGSIDILVNNAIYQPLADYPLRRLRLTYAVNVEAPFELMQAVLPGMLAVGEGWIVNLSSATARPRPGPPFTQGAGSRMAVYGSSKAALNRPTNALQTDDRPNEWR